MVIAGVDKVAKKNLQMQYVLENPSKKTVKEIRNMQGFGSRTINIKKNANKNDIKNIVLRLFFPGGKSHIGQKHHFTHRIGNFRGKPLLDNFSLADYAGEHKLTHV